MKKISIVTVTYNCEKAIKETILSVLAQDYSCLEYVIIDGASKDSTLSIIQSFGDKIHKIVSEKDKGIFDAMNKSLAYVTGEYVLFMNAGDTFVNSHVVSDIFNSYSGNDDLIYGDDYVRNDLGYLFRKASSIYQSQYTKRDLVFKSQGFSHQSLFTKVSLLRKIKFNLAYPLGADYHTTWQIYELNHSIKYVNMPISIFDDREGGASHKKGFIDEIYLERITMFSYQLKIIDKLFICFMRYKVNFQYRFLAMFPSFTARYRNFKRNYVSKL